MPANSSVEVIKVSVALLVIGGGLVWSAIRRQRKIREVEDLASSKVDSAAQGLTELQGFAWSKVAGPKSLEGHELVYYSFQLQKQVKEGSGKNRKTTWRTVFSRGHFQPFYLIDATGLVVVDPARGEFLIDEHKTRDWTFLSPVEKNFYLTNVVQTPVADFPPSNFLFGLFSSKFRIVENDLKEGSPVYVKGDFRTEAEYTAKVKVSGLSKFYAQVFNEQSRSARNINVLLDTNKDGKISHREMMIAYIRFAKFARSQARLTEHLEKEFSIYGVIRSSDNHQLLFADTHQNQLIERLRRWYFLKLIIGGLLLVVALAAPFLLAGV